MDAEAATSLQNPSETPLVDQRCREIGKSGVDWHHSATLISELARTLERRATLAERRCGELERALTAADDLLHQICGSYMSIPHGEPEKHFWDVINGMGPTMDIVRKAAALTPKPEPKGETE